jgi:hypothetical protein
METQKPILEHYKKLFNPDYVGSWDFVIGADANGKPLYKELTVTIESLEIKTISIAGKEMPDTKIMKFVGGKKPFIVKAENARLLAKSCGTPFHKNWIGKKITLHVVPVSVMREVVDAVRVKYIKPQ